MINLQNVRRAVSSNDLQVLRNLNAFIDYFGSIFEIGKYEPMDSAELSKLLQNLNTTDYRIYDADNSSAVVDDAKKLYFNLIEIARAIP